MKTFKKILILSIVAIAGLLVGTFTNFSSPSTPIPTTQAATTIHLEEDDEGWSCEIDGNKSCESVESVYEAEAYKVLSVMPIDPLVASGEVGYKYIETVETTDPQLSPSYFAIVSPTNPNLVHIMKADWLTKA